MSAIASDAINPKLRKRPKMPFKIQTGVDDIPAFLAHHISRTLDEADVSFPHPTADDIRYEPTRREAEVDTNELCWSIDIGDGFSVPLLVLLGVGLTYDRNWFLGTATWLAAAAVVAAQKADDYKRTYARLAPLAHRGFKRLRRAKLPVRLIEVSILPVMPHRMHGGIMIEWESFDKQGIATKGFWDIGNEDELEERFIMMPLMFAYEAG